MDDPEPHPDPPKDDALVLCPKQCGGCHGLLASPCPIAVCTNTGCKQPAQVFFRMSANGKRWYLFDMLLGWQAVAISRVDMTAGTGPEKLSVVNCPLQRGQEYHVLIAARGASLTTYVDGKLYNQLTDAWLSAGPIGLNVWESKTAFRDPRIRHMS